jgi:hypothetical protein
MQSPSALTRTKSYQSVSFPLDVATQALSRKPAQKPEKPTGKTATPEQKNVKQHPAA